MAGDIQTRLLTCPDSLEGLVWVSLYYCQDCASWTWF